MDINLCSIAFSIAAFAYVGVDITAAIALEARLDSKRPQGEKSFWPTISVRFVATWTTFIIWIIYFLAGIMLSFNVYWENPNLPRESFLGSPVSRTDSNQIKSNSGFVISASLSKIPGLDNVVAVIILVTVIFSANTNLYVASRSLLSSPAISMAKIGTCSSWLSLERRIVTMCQSGRCCSRVVFCGCRFCTFRRITRPIRLLPA